MHCRWNEVSGDNKKEEKTATTKYPRGKENAQQEKDNLEAL